MNILRYLEIEMKIYLDRPQRLGVRMPTLPPRIRQILPDLRQILHRQQTHGLRGGRLLLGPALRRPKKGLRVSIVTSARDAGRLRWIRIYGCT